MNPLQELSSRRSKDSRWEPYRGTMALKAPMRASPIRIQRIPERKIRGIILRYDALRSIREILRRTLPQLRQKLFISLEMLKILNVLRPQKPILRLDDRSTSLGERCFCIHGNSSISVRNTQQIKTMSLDVPDQKCEIPDNVVKPLAPRISANPGDNRIKIVAEQRLNKGLADFD